MLKLNHTLTALASLLFFYPTHTIGKTTNDYFAADRTVKEVEKHFVLSISKESVSTCFNEILKNLDQNQGFVLCSNSFPTPLTELKNFKSIANPVELEMKVEAPFLNYSFLNKVQLETEIQHEDFTEYLISDEGSTNKPILRVAYEITPEGAWLTIAKYQQDYFIKLNNQDMSVAYQLIHYQLRAANYRIPVTYRLNKEH